MKAVIVILASMSIAISAYGQPVFSRYGDANVRVLAAQSLTSSATVDGTPLSKIASEAAQALPTTGGQLSGQLQATINLGTTANTYGMGDTITAGGSGTNGPRSAQTGATFQAFKLNWDQTTVTPNVGEVDGVSVLTRQGGVGSDSSGILVNVQNTGVGFLSMTEMVSSAISTTNYAIQDAIDIQEGVIDEPNSNKIGTVYNMTYGTGTNAILIQNDAGAYWQNVLRYTKDGTLEFLVDGNGVVTATGLIVSSTEQHSGTETHSGTATFSSISQTTRPVTQEHSSYTFKQSDCGTIVRDASSSSQTYTVPSLPTGCVIDFIEASSSANATFVGSGMTLEQTGGGTLLHKTTGQFAYVKIFIDTTSTALLQGDID